MSMLDKYMEKIIQNRAKFQEPAEKRQRVRVIDITLARFGSCRLYNPLISQYHEEWVSHAVQLVPQIKPVDEKNLWLPKI